MSFKTLNIGATALMTSQLALNTVGHNVSNAATPGYTRQRVMTHAALPDVKTFGVLGSGVVVGKVSRVADEFLETQVREATTLFKYFETQINHYENIEGIFNELTENDLSSAFDDFWSGVSDVTNYVEDISTRRTLIFQAEVLADSFRNIDTKLYEMRRNINNKILDTVNQVNTLTTEIARLNQDVVRAEQGGIGNKIANDSRDQRTENLRQLSEIMNVTVTEEDNGQVIVSLNGRLLVFENQSYDITTEKVEMNDMLIERVVFASDLEEIAPTTGSLTALMEMRDTILVSYADDVDRLAAQFIWDFNRLHSQGQGLVGYSEVSSTVGVIDPLKTLDELDFAFNPLSNTYNPKNGNLELIVRNEISGEVTTMNIEIDLDNTGEPDTILYHNNNVDQYNTLSNVNLTGLEYDANTDTNGELYFNVYDSPLPGIDILVEIYSDAAQTNLVAQGTVLPVGSTSGTVTITEVAGSGINGEIDINYTADDATIVRTDLFENSFYSKLTSALDGFEELYGIDPSTFTVSIDNSNKLSLTSNSENYTLGFGRDTSGVLATLGMNIFFSGYDAGTIGVADDIKDNPDFFAGATTFESGDNTNAQSLLQLRNEKIYNNDTATADDYYQGIIGRLGIEFSQKRSLQETQEDILLSVTNQREDLSGVNLDEELTLMIQFQRSYQAAARFISTADALYEALMNM
ncbi:MAG: flagellar hook-associated protein FlgK [Planctomycetes bacterium]|nr:flagellar hook-associated protein FlgK [Planctomycetota bacterium]